MEHYLLHKDADRVSCGATEIANRGNIEVNPEREAVEGITRQHVSPHPVRKKLIVATKRDATSVRNRKGGGGGFETVVAIERGPSVEPRNCRDTQPIRLAPRRLQFQLRSTGR